MKLVVQKEAGVAVEADVSISSAYVRVAPVVVLAVVAVVAVVAVEIAEEDIERTVEVEMERIVGLQCGR